MVHNPTWQLLGCWGCWCRCNSSGRVVHTRAKPIVCHRPVRLPRGARGCRGRRPAHVAQVSVLKSQGGPKVGLAGAASGRPRVLIPITYRGLEVIVKGLRGCWRVAGPSQRRQKRRQTAAASLKREKKLARKKGFFFSIARATWPIWGVKSQEGNGRQLRRVRGSSRRRSGRRRGRRSGRSGRRSGRRRGHKIGRRARGSG